MDGLEEGALVEQWRRVQDAYMRTSNAIDRELESRFDIGFNEFEVLDLVSETGLDECRMKKLADHTPLTQSALSRIVDRLEKAGLITRSACSDDRRAIFVELTEQGRALHREAAVVHRGVLRENLPD
ncbi:MarR family winged helix-turn-helix transcriptional regulator [Pseudarthrobacter sp. P1]|uniref:MarR family winged helix-turn-helix transcriptional regulator n=1 Tax=Pseudarthrobacter sp. P1 TaxID=3418418 RepID=UPI003CEF0A93